MSPLPSVAFYNAISFLMPDLWLFHTSSNSAMPLGVLQFDSLLALSTWRERQIPQIKGSVIQDSSPSPAKGNLRSQVSTFQPRGFESVVPMMPTLLSIY